MIIICTLREGQVEGIVLLQQFYELPGGYFVIAAFQEMVTAVHPPVGMGDGDCLEALHLVDGFLRQNGHQRAAAH